MTQILKLTVIISVIDAIVALFWKGITYPFLKDSEKALVSTEARYLQERYWKGNYFTTQGLGSIGEILVAVVGESIAGGGFALSFILIFKVLIGVRLPFSLMAWNLFVGGQAHLLLILSRSENLRKGHMNVRLATLLYWGSISFVKLSVLAYCGIFSSITINLYIAYYFLSFFFGSPGVTKYNEYKNY